MDVSHLPPRPAPLPLLCLRAPFLIPPLSCPLGNVTINNLVHMTWHAFSGFYDVAVGRSGPQEQGIVGS